MHHEEIKPIKKKQHEAIKHCPWINVLILHSINYLARDIISLTHWLLVFEVEHDCNKNKDHYQVISVVQ
jgi:hypothetical protein